MDDLLVRIPLDVFEVFCPGLSGDGQAVAIDQAGFVQRLHQHGHAARFAEILGNIVATGFEVRDVRRLLEDLRDVFEIELNAALMRHGWQMKRRIGRAAGRGDDDGRILEGFPRTNIARAQILLDQLHHHFTTGHGIAVTVGVRRWQRRGERQGEADGLRDAGHRVRRELAAARPVARTGDLFQRVKFLVGHLVRASGMRAHSLEHVKHGDIAALIGARQD